MVAARSSVGEKMIEAAMDSHARLELSRSIQKEGAGLSDDPERIKALLLDTCPEARTEIGLLVAAAEDEIPSRLSRSSESVLFRDGEIARAVSDLKRTRRLDHGAAEWAVRSWAWALGVLDEEPSDDPADAAQASPGPGFISGGQSGPPQYPSGPPPQVGMSAPAVPSQPAGQAAHAQVAAPSWPPQSPPPSWPASGHPSHPSQPWPPAAGHPLGAGPGGPPWGMPPSDPGAFVAAPPPPPGKARGRVAAVVAAAVGVVVLAVLAVVFLRPGPTATTQAVPPVPTAAPAPPTAPPTPAEVNFTITNSLGEFELADTATIYSFGKKIGTLQVSTSSPYAELPVSGLAGPIQYELSITMVLADTGGSITLNGSGTITAVEGGVYSVQIVQDTVGNWVATLQAGEGA
jgi:hypothetical protein